ncbi:uncharacterized protein [Malus domestica]|uniref:uncharacterized protein n=1 Tax=Malus domestica TaxID=3750 RepID=UPI00397502AE
MRLEAMDFLHFQKECLDVVLAPSGLLIMLIYHFFLLYKYVNYPLSTAIGSENNDKKVWVGKILQGEDVQVAKKVKTALDVISSNTSATTSLAPISLTLCALIGAWMANSNNNNFPKQIIYGNTNPSTISIKGGVAPKIPVDCTGSHCEKKKAEREVERGSEFWSLGLRALYFALNFLLWFFGPIPMFTSSVATVVILACHDFKNSGGDQKCPASANARNERLLLVS